MNKILKNVLAFAAPFVIAVVLGMNNLALSASFMLMLCIGIIIAALIEDKRLELNTLYKWSVILSLTFAIVIICFSSNAEMSSTGYFLILYGPPVLITVVSWYTTKKWTAGAKALGIIFILFLAYFAVTGVLNTSNAYVGLILILFWFLQSLILALIAYFIQRGKKRAAEKLESENSNKKKWNSAYTKKSTKNSTKNNNKPKN